MIGGLHICILGARRWQGLAGLDPCLLAPVHKGVLEGTTLGLEQQQPKLAEQPGCGCPDPVVARCLAGLGTVLG